MFQLFGRIAWAISITLGFCVSFVIFLLWSGSISSNDAGGVIVILTIISTLIIKKLLFSQQFIEQRVRFFADAISSTKPGKIKASSQKVEQDTQETPKEPKTISIPLKSKEEVKASPSSSPLILAITWFFKENILAKIGAILLFLGVLFFLNLIYVVVGPVAKVIIGLLLGFGVYGTWVYLDKKWFVNESRILLWLGILINYLVILSGRYLIGDDISPSGILSVGITFLFLILNTVFAVLTSLLYQSRVMLLFSFIFAYINPLLVGWSSDTPYVVLGYATIITVAILSLVWNKKYKVDDTILSYIAFFGANGLFFLAPFDSDISWLAKFGCFVLVSLVFMYSSYKREKYSEIIPLMWASYVFLLALSQLIHSWLPNVLENQVFGLATEVSFLPYLLLLSIPLLLFIISCVLAGRKWLSSLYLIGVIGTTITMWSIITITGDVTYIMLSCFALFIFWAVHILSPFFWKSYFENTTTFYHYIIGFILGVLYIIFYIHAYMSEYYPWITIGIALFLAGVVYFFVTYLRMISLEIWMKNTPDSLEKNMVLTYAFSALSIFTLSLPFIFPNNKEVISTLWLLETSMLLYFFHALKEYKIYIVSMILMFIGVVQMASYVNQLIPSEYFALIPIGIMTALLYVNTQTLKAYVGNTIRIPYDIIQALMVGMILTMLSNIAPLDSLGVPHIFTTVFFVLLWFIYSLGSSVIQKWIFIVMFWILALGHVSEIENILYNISNQENVLYLLLQYITSIMIIGLWIGMTKYVFAWHQKIAFSIISFLYGFIISTIYIYDIFATTFAVTIYWWTLAFVSLIYGISHEIIRYRTLGLYILSLTLWKILLYDIWIGFDNPIVRVWALMVVGILMIIISMMYSKKYGNNLVWEFEIKNLK